LEVRAEDQANLLFFSRESTQLRSFIFDVTPPRVEVLSGEHYLRQGGAEAVLYRVTEGVESGVQVGERLFRGYPAASAEEGTHLALFALAWDQAPETPIFLWAEDTAGNRARSSFWYRTFPRTFRQRPIQVTDQFISKIAPEILSNTDEISEQDTLLETFLEINDRLRKLNNARIAEMSQQSANHLLWEAPFQQLSNSQVESHFADDRTYFYDGDPVDRQTHLGFDLASLARSPVEASNAGQVLFADYLGIYGNCVLIDHGLGLSSLYAHLSSTEVQPGDRVLRGQVIGRTGQTGLAAGDHLHFTLVLQGVQVTPIEWWDENWVRLHVLEKVISGPDS
jgi:murein DD-endopeptidase MepM/ murein hydrolase activator NlpD